MRQSLQELMEQYQNNLYATAFNVCKNAEAVEDVVQDTFIQYHTTRKEFESVQHIQQSQKCESYFLETEQGVSGGLSGTGNRGYSENLGKQCQSKAVTR